MYRYDKVLPIGTVVLLNNAEKRLMIIGYQRKTAADRGGYRAGGGHCTAGAVPAGGRPESGSTCAPLTQS